MKNVSKGKFLVRYDGPSRPIVTGPIGTMLCIDGFNDGRWGWYENEEGDSQLLAEALTVFNDTGQSPCELLRENRRLLAVLKSYECCETERHPELALDNES